MTNMQNVLNFWRMRNITLEGENNNLQNINPFMDWFLYDIGLRHERVKHLKLYI